MIPKIKKPYENSGQDHDPRPRQTKQGHTCFRLSPKGINKTLVYVLVGILGGLSSATLIYSLDFVTHYRETHSFLVWFLPVAGFLSVALYQKFGKVGGNLIFEEIHEPRKVLPLRMAPLIFFNTLLTHLFGGSAGREGTAVQMGASLADQLSRFFSMEKEDRKPLLMAGLSSAFGATLGCPWAGALFGMEVIERGKLRYHAWIECLFSSWMGYETIQIISKIIGFPLSEYLPVENIPYNFQVLISILLFGMVCGFFAFAFSKTIHFLESVLVRISYAPLRPFVTGLVIVGFYFLIGSYDYAGLGIPMIKRAFVEPLGVDVPLYKFFSTVLTVSSGFKGGEFIPLVFMGSTLGSFFSHMLNVPTPLLAALGFGAVFAGAANVPLTCSVLLIEIFGAKIGFYALLTCWVSFYCSGNHTIYQGQKLFAAQEKQAKN